MTPTQIAAAELEKMQYCAPHQTTPDTHWIKTGRIASQTLHIKDQKTSYRVQIVVAFTDSAHHEIEESWCQKI
jgi:hypothetical protein